MKAKLVKADVSQFAAYQVIYRGADTELWFDWYERLEDSKWATDQSFFLEIDGQKIGGAVIGSDYIWNAFLIPPFNDKMVFWEQLLKLTNPKTIYGVWDEDKNTISMLDYKLINTKTRMVRPPEVVEQALESGFSCHPINGEIDTLAVAQVIQASFINGIVYEQNGVNTVDEVKDALESELKDMDIKNMSHIIMEDCSKKIVATILAGIGPKNPLGFSFIDKVAVHPEYRGKGLAKYLVNLVLTESVDVAPFVKLGLIVGNPAQRLYTKLGFMSGPNFSTFEKR